MTKTIGLVVDGLSSTASAEIAIGAHAEAGEDTLLIATGDAAETATKLHDYVDGLLISNATTGLSLPPAFVAGLSIVLVYRREPLGGVPSVIVDDHAGIALATQHLLELGHTRIAHIAGPQHADTARRRRQGFLDTIASAGCALGDCPVVETTFDEAGGYRAALELLDAPRVPTAFVTSTVAAAAGALAALRVRALRSPNDVSVVGFDEAPAAKFLEPSLTTVQMPLRQLGRDAVTVLRELLAGRVETEHTVLDTPPRLLVRTSTAPPPAR